MNTRKPNECFVCYIKDNPPHGATPGEAAEIVCMTLLIDMIRANKANREMTIAMCETHNKLLNTSKG